MEKYTMFMDWKNQYSENEYTTQSNLKKKKKELSVLNLWGIYGKKSQDTDMFFKA